jgi:inorganic pyrophosphatase
MDRRFWARVEDLVATSEIVVDRPQRAPGVDYGYLAGTTAADGEGVDVWIGSLPEKRVTGAIMTVDTRPDHRDVEVKLLLGCTRDDASRAMDAQGASMEQTVIGSYLIWRD